MVEMGHAGSNVVVVSGEIHLATRATMPLDDGRMLHQLVASGIAHRAPPRAWARFLGLLASLGEAPLAGRPIRIGRIPGQSGRYVAQRKTHLTLTWRSGEWLASWQLEDSGRSPDLPLSQPARRGSGAAARRRVLRQKPDQRLLGAGAVSLRIAQQGKGPLGAGQRQRADPAGRRRSRHRALRQRRKAPAGGDGVQHRLVRGQFQQQRQRRDSSPCPDSQPSNSERVPEPGSRRIQLCAPSPVTGTAASSAQATGSP